MLYSAAFCRFVCIVCSHCVGLQVGTYADHLAVLRAGLDSVIKLSQPVTKIRVAQTESKTKQACVWTKDSVFVADAVVVTLPLGVLQAQVRKLAVVFIHVLMHCVRMLPSSQYCRHANSRRSHECTRDYTTRSFWSSTRCSGRYLNSFSVPFVLIMFVAVAGWCSVHCVRLCAGQERSRARARMEVNRQAAALAGPRAGERVVLQSGLGHRPASTASTHHGRPG